MVVSKTKSGRYFASVQVAMDGPERPPPKPEAAAVGVDVGLKSLLVTSDGSVIEPPKYLEKSAKKMAWLQRKLSRCQKGSAGRKKMGLKVARQHEKVAKQRADFLHKTSRSLVDSYGLVGIEYLNGRGLVQNHRLARAISDAGWGEFRRQLVYKGQWDGAQIVVIDRFFSSSRRCSACGYVLPELKLSVREWDCPVCGAHHERDLNMAVNIRIEAQTRAGTAQRYTEGEGVSPIARLAVLSELGSHLL